MKDRNEQTARNKWCPFACINFVINQAGEHAHSSYNVTPYCKGNNCIFWEEKTEDAGICSLAPK